MSTATESIATEYGADNAAPAARSTTYVKAFNEGVAQVMRENDDVFVIGEDVAAYGGVFHMYDGLLAEFGERRMVDTPIAEMGLIGLGVGAAARGLRPIVDIMFMDFLAVALDQVVNQAAKMKFMYGGEPGVVARAYPGTQGRHAVECAGCQGPPGVRGSGRQPGRVHAQQSAARFAR